MSFIIIKDKGSTKVDFWQKVENFYGEIPKIVRLVLEITGFDSHLALKGISWEDKSSFFNELQSEVRGLVEIDDNDPCKRQLVEELNSNHQKLENFQLKLGHKNLIINLCHELQKTSLEEFNGKTIKIQESPRSQQEIIVRKSEEHGYSRENEILNRKRTACNAPVVVVQPPLSENTTDPNEVESMHFQYETEEEYVEAHEEEFLEEEDFEHEYEEEIEMDNGLYTSETVVKSEYNTSDCFEISGYESSTSTNRAAPPKSKKPKHMYTEQFLRTQELHGRVGTPGRRRPKIQKNYPDTEEGLLERWADLIRQSCEVIVPAFLLNQHDLTTIDIVKMSENVWEVRCPMCTKKLRLQLTQEGKYTNYKRSNFERHLRIVHYKQISQFKPVDSEDDHIFMESSQ